MAIASQNEISIVVIVIVTLIMIFKPSILGNVYNNVFGKLFLVACIVFLTLKHTIAGLLGVVFIAVIASNSVFEGNENKDNSQENEKKHQLVKQLQLMPMTKRPQINNQILALLL